MHEDITCALSILSEKNLYEARQHVEDTFCKIIKKYGQTNALVEVYDKFIYILFHEYYEYYADNHINFRKLLYRLDKDLYEMNDITIIYFINNYCDTSKNNWRKHLDSVVYHVCNFYRIRIDMCNDDKMLLKEKLKRLCKDFIRHDCDELFEKIFYKNTN